VKFRKREQKRRGLKLQLILSALGTSLLASFPWLKSISYLRHRDRRIISGFYGAVLFLERVAWTRGTSHASKILKVFSNECRLAAMEQRRPIFQKWFWWVQRELKPSPEQLLQLSFIGRALPEPDQWEVKDSLERHLRNLGEKPDHLNES
jgi:hypothetical protein